MTAAMRTAVSILVNTLLVIVSSAIALVGAVIIFELAYRVAKDPKNIENWHYTNTQFDAELGWSPKLDNHVVLPWGEATSNSMGFRSAEIDPKKKQILLVGDSVTWGFGVDDKQVASYYLDRLVSPLGYQVTNLGVGGYALGQYYLYLKRNIGKIPNVKRIVVILYAGNDRTEMLANAAYGKRKPLFILEKGQLKLTNSPIKKYCLRNLISKSYLLKRFAELPGPFKISLKFIPVLGDVRIDKEQGGKIVLLLLTRIEQLAADKGAKLTILLSPAESDFTEKSEEYAWFESLLKSQPYDTIDYLEVVKNSGQDPRQLYVEHSHYNRAGNEFLARTLFDHLKLGE